MKPSLKTALLIIAILLPSCQNLLHPKVSSNDKPAANDPSSAIVATYNDGQVTLKDANSELYKLILKNGKLKGLTFDKLSTDQKEAVIKEVVLKDVIYKEGKKRNLDKDADYQEALKLFEAELLKQKLMIAIAKEAADEKNVKKNYDELVEKLKGKKDIRISYIAVKTEKEANAIYQSLLKSPNSFAAQAKKKSLDKEVGKNGGDLGFVMEDMLPADILIQARTISKGRIARPVFNSGKWIIVKLEGERPAEIIPYEKAKDALARNLAKKAIEDFSSQSLERAKISVLLK